MLQKKPGSCSGQPKSELAQRTKILLWLTSNGLYTPTLQQLQPSLRPTLCKHLRRHLRALRNGQVLFIVTKKLESCGVTLSLKTSFHFSKTLIIYICRLGSCERALLQLLTLLFLLFPQTQCTETLSLCNFVMPMSFLHRRSTQLPSL